MNQRNLVFKSISLLLLLLGARDLARINAQTDSFSATLTVLYQGVELQRAGTDTWLSLSPGAQMPFGAGDRVRTDDIGRVLLSFLDAGNVYLLPNSEYVLVNFSQDTDQSLHLSARMNGVMIQHTFAPLDTFTLKTGRITVTQPASSFAAWSELEKTSIVTVTSGEAQVLVSGDTDKVPAQHGFLTDNAGERVVRPLDYPHNAARFMGLIYGCPAQIKTADGRNMNVRMGPGFPFTVIGSLPNETEVRLLGIIEEGTWYRTQMLSGFGWVYRELVNHQCNELPVVSHYQMEKNRSVFDASEFELEMLEPYYGAPEDDLWFYLMPLPRTADSHE